MATQLESLVPTFNRLYIFGDSLSDPGNLFELTGFFPPPPYSEGRFSNGDIWANFIAKSLAFDTEQVLNFAYGGSTSGPTNALEPLVESLAGIDLTLPSLPNQIATYISELPGDGSNANGVHVLWIGANDLFNAPTDPTQIPGFLATSVNNIADSISQLAAAGADTFLIPNLPDLGKTPRGLSSGNSQQATTLSTLFNTSLANTLPSLETALGIDIIEVNIFERTNAILSSPADFGLTNVTDPLIQQITPANPEGYFWWDDIHPTTSVHEMLSDAFLEELTQAGYLVPETETAKELFDLTGLNGTVAVNVTLSREAAHDNILQFYQTDANGAVQGILPGQAGYEDAARAALLASPQIFIFNRLTLTETVFLPGGAYYAPALLVDGNVNNLVTVDDAFTSADRIRREGNTWRLEDWDDFDFNDLVLTVNSTQVVT
jgi:phospholipase/lecithinase/hemolysin